MHHRFEWKQTKSQNLEKIWNAFLDCQIPEPNYLTETKVTTHLTRAKSNRSSFLKSDEVDGMIASFRATPEPRKRFLSVKNVSNGQQPTFFGLITAIIARWFSKLCFKSHDLGKNFDWFIRQNGKAMLADKKTREINS